MQRVTRRVAVAMSLVDPARTQISARATSTHCDFDSTKRIENIIELGF